MPALPKLASGGRPGAFCPMSRLIQIPDRSGLPSAVRGAGAERFGLPSGPFGTFGVGCNGHCADSDEDRAITSAPSAVQVSELFMQCSTWCARDQSTTSLRAASPAPAHHLSWRRECETSFL